MDTSLLAFPKPKDKIKADKIKTTKNNTLKSKTKLKSKKGINKVSKKRSKQCRKDKKIYNKLVEDSYVCEICGNKEATQIHHIFGASNRDNSTKYGFLKHICNDCHKKIDDDEKLDEKYKILAEKEFLKKHTKEEFLAIFGKSYI